MKAKLQSVLDRLYAHTNFEHKNRPYNADFYTLEPIRSLLRLVGDPQKNLKSIHIAGTKGKGSTAYYLAVLLHSNGHKVGLYASPSIKNLRDRFCVAMRPAPWRRLVPVLSRVLDLAAATKNLKPTVFDLLTASAFVLFSQEKVDYAIIEVGLGGRLDSTNVLAEPALSVITTIALDHTQQLGSTLADIAREKAGIVKPGVSVLFQPQGEEIDDVVAGAAEAKNAPFIVPKWLGDEVEAVADSLPSFQRQNFNLALNAADLLGEPLPSVALLQKSLKKHPLVGRYYWNSKVLYDGAHNPSAMARLVEAIAENASDFPKPKMHVVCYFLPGKDVLGMLEKIPKEWRLTYYELDLQNLPQSAKDEVVGVVRSERQSEVVRSLKQLKGCLRSDENLVVTGSFRLVGHLLAQNPSWSKGVRGRAWLRSKKKNLLAKKDWMV